MDTLTPDIILIENVNVDNKNRTVEASTRLLVGHHDHRQLP